MIIIRFDRRGDRLRERAPSPRMLEEKGALLLDADRIAREVVLPGKEAWREIRDWLGGRRSPALTALSTGDRLGKLVFTGSRRAAALNGIVFPSAGF